MSSGDSSPVSCVVMWHDPHGDSHWLSHALQQYFIRSCHGFWTARSMSLPITSSLSLSWRESPHIPLPPPLAPSPASWAARAPAAAASATPLRSRCSDATKAWASSRGARRGRSGRSPRRQPANLWAWAGERLSRRTADRVRVTMTTPRRSGECPPARGLRLVQRARLLQRHVPRELPTREHRLVQRARLLQRRAPCELRATCRTGDDPPPRALHGRARGKGQGGRAVLLGATKRGGKAQECASRVE